jgi:hypothetical protein
MRFGVFPTMLFLVGCAATPSAYEPPVVDMRGVDQQKYAQDLHECTDLKKAAGFITVGPMISNCLTERGYKVEIAKS